MRKSLHSVQLALKYPDLAVKKLRETVRGRLNVFRGLRDDTGFSLHPIVISLNMTNACNLRCKMCPQWGESGFYSAVEGQGVAESLPFETIKSVIDELAPYGTKIHLWGGEPFLNHRIIDVIRYIKKKGLVCTINTNGTLLYKFADELVELGVDCISISIDGPPEIHDAIRGKQGVFQKVMEGVKAIKESKQRRKSSLPLLRVLTTLNGANCHLGREIIEMVASEPAFDSLCFLHGMFTTEDVGIKNEKVFQKLFNCESKSWKGLVGTMKGIDIEKVKELVQYVAKRRELPEVSSFPSLTPEEVSRYYSDASSIINNNICLFPWVLVDIRPNGDVTPCPDIPDFIAGNVKEKKFREIWNGEPLRTFRKNLRKYGTFPICPRCCGLNHYGKRIKTRFN